MSDKVSKLLCAPILEEVLALVEVSSASSASLAQTLSQGFKLDSKSAWGLYEATSACKLDP